MSNRPGKKDLASQRVRKASQTGATSRRTLWIVAAVGLAIAVALGFAIAATSGSSDPDGGGASPSGGTVVPSGDLSFGEVEVSGSLPPLPQAGADPAVGQPAPTLTGSSFDGATTTIGDDGRPKVVMFLAHWCPHCQAEVPAIQSWLDDHGMPADVDLYAVATATDRARPNFPPGRWLRQEGWSVPTVVDDEATAALQAFGVSGYPTFVAIGADGEVVARASGQIGIAAWEDLLEAARRG